MSTEKLNYAVLNQEPKINGSKVPVPAFSIEAFEDAEFLKEKKESENIFPSDIFPSPFYEVITETQKTLNFPVDYTGTAILTAIATAIGKSAKMRVKKGWYEFPAIYASLIGKPGSNKSHPIETAFKPFEEIDRTQIKKFEQDITNSKNFRP